MKKRLDGGYESIVEINRGEYCNVGRDGNFNTLKSGSISGLANIDQHWPHVFNLVNSIVGVSILAMPYCIQQCGILLGSILIAICALLSKVTCHMLYDSAFTSRKRNFEGVATYAFGTRGCRFVQMLMILFLMSSIVSSLVVIGDIGPHLMPEYLRMEKPTQRLRILAMALAFIFIILPLCLMSNYDSLAVVSSATVFFYFLFVIRIVFECFPRILEGFWSYDIRWWRSEGILHSLPIIFTALSCQIQLFCVADCMNDPSILKVNSIVATSINLCSGIYAAVGIFGYVAYYDTHLHGDILLYMQNSLFTQILKLLFMLSVAFSIPLALFPSRIAFYNLFSRQIAGEFAVNQMSGGTFVLLTLFMLTINFLIAVGVPNVEFILGITGALIGSMVTVVMPACLYLLIVPSSAVNSTMLRYAKVSLMIGLLMLIGSTLAIVRTGRGSIVVDKIIPKQFEGNADTVPKKSARNENVVKEISTSWNIYDKESANRSKQQDKPSFKEVNSVSTVAIVKLNRRSEDKPKV